MKIILATASPYRIEAMKYCGIDFETRASNVEENLDGRPNTPGDLVRFLSKLKAEAVAKECMDSLILGFDSVGYFEGKILEKPKSYEEAFERLKRFSGNSHGFYTGITIINQISKKTRQEFVSTKVDFRDLSEYEIKKYLSEDGRYNTFSLGYDPLTGISSFFIKRVEGDFNNLCRGIPIARVIELIEEELMGLLK